MADPNSLSPDEELRFRMLIFSMFENVRLTHEQHETGAEVGSQLTSHLEWLESMLS
jgi:hypothetical protein